MIEPKTVCLLLHAHLPFGLRPDLPISLEDSWLFEAVTDCYLPLLRLAESLPRPAKLAVSLSPTLIELWARPDFPQRYSQHLVRYLAILVEEADNKHFPSQRRSLADAYAKQIQLAKRDFFEHFNGDLPKAWGRLAQAGRIELLTTAATHAFLPALQNLPLSRKLQLEMGIERFTALTGQKPTGFWLPECGYFPGLEADLAAIDVKWFAVENMGGETVTRCPNGITAIARQSALSRKVWDAKVGYPGHANYREFHRDAIHELPPEHAGLYRLPDGSSLPLGMKYWRVTGDGQKEFYEADSAGDQAESDAHDFVDALAEAKEPFIFLPFDAELFGHWWHEGPQWLASVIRHTTEHSNLHLTTPSHALEALDNIPTGQPLASTWGRNADYSFWINTKTDWIFPQIAVADGILSNALASDKTDALHERVIRQMTRELLLAQASDWPFMISAEATAQYAEERLRQHLARFHFLARQLKESEIDEAALTALEFLDPLFSDR